MECSQDSSKNFRIAVLGDEKTVTGFKLAGVKKAIVASDDSFELLKQFNSITSEPNVGLLILDSTCHKILKEVLLFIELNRMPVIIEMPSWKERPGSEIFNFVVGWASGIKKR
ncbi:MAG: V-type ATP synthase subunit F [Candidatus Diapherotrites archaeon]